MTDNRRAGRVECDAVQESRSFERPHTEARAVASVDLDVLATRVAHGDHAAFEVIYNTLVDELYGYARGQCRDADAAEDIVADVFLKAWRSARAFRPGNERYRSWLFAIARNELRDYWRTLPRTVPILDLDFSDPVLESSVEERDDMRGRINDALASLTPDQREVVVLRYYSGKTHDEIASIMSKRAGAVRSLQLRALRRMRKVLHDASP